MKYAKGTYIAFLDDDDEWVPEKLFLQLKAMEKSPDYPSIIYSGVILKESGTVLRETNPSTSGWMQDYIFKGFLLPSSSILVPTKELKIIGGHSEELISCIDHDMWMKMAQSKFFMQALPKALTIRYKSQHSRMTNRLNERFKGIELFFAKWKPYVIKNYGINHWQAIEFVYETETFPIIKHKYIQNQIHLKDALSYYRKFFWWQTRFFTKKYLLLFINYIAIRIGLIEYCLLQNNKRKLAKDLITLRLKLRY